MELMKKYLEEVELYKNRNVWSLVTDSSEKTRQIVIFTLVYYFVNFTYATVGKFKKRL